MNGRLIQRIFDPRTDLLKAKWSPFHSTSWSLPLLDKFKYMRPQLIEISNEVYNWNNATDLLIIADYPDLVLRNMLPVDIVNGSLTILEGAVLYENESLDGGNVTVIRLITGQQQQIPSNTLYTVKTIGKDPAVYMITFTNRTILMANNSISLEGQGGKQIESRINFPLEFQQRIENYRTFLKHISNGLANILYGIPIPIKVRKYSQRKETLRDL